MVKEALNHMEEKSLKSIEVMKHEFASIRAGRANPAVLDKIKVDYYGTPTAINQMAAISVSEARILVIAPWDASTLSPIEKAIQASDLGINPTNDGKVIRIAFPALTEERRREIVKQIHKLKEEAKIAVRNIRRDCNEHLKAAKKNHEITEDEFHESEEKSQKLTDKYCKSLDELAQAKEKEIMEI